ncbi:hypothetical protein YC2023_119872 [Brassica napus]
MNDSDTKSQAASGYSPLSGPDSATQADVNRPLLTENSNPRPTLSLPSGPTTLFTIPKTLLTARTLNTRRTLTLPFASRPSGLTTLSLLEAPRTLLPSYQIESQATAGSPRRSDSNSSRLSDTDSPRRSSQLPFSGSGGVSTPAGDDEEVLGDPLLGAEAAVLADAKAWAKFLEVSNSFIQWMISTLFLLVPAQVIFSFAKLLVAIWSPSPSSSTVIMGLLSELKEKAIFPIFFLILYGCFYMGARSFNKKSLKFGFDITSLLTGFLAILVILYFLKDDEGYTFGSLFLYLVVFLACKLWDCC